MNTNTSKRWSANKYEYVSPLSSDIGLFQYAEVM